MSTTREKIIDASIKLFAENGFDGVTTKQIAKTAGVSEVTVFRNFESKRALFTAVIKDNLHPYRAEQYLKKQATYDLETDVRAVANTIVATMEKNLPYMRMLFKDKHSKGSHKRAKDHDNKIKASIEQYFTTMHNQGKLGVPPKMATRFLFMNITSVMAEALFCKDKPLDRAYFDWMVEKVIDVIKAKH